MTLEPTALRERPRQSALAGSWTRLIGSQIWRGQVRQFGTAQWEFSLTRDGVRVLAETFDSSKVAEQASLLHRGSVSKRASHLVPGPVDEAP